jgi:hypothetical protein
MCDIQSVLRERHGYIERRERTGKREGEAHTRTPTRVNALDSHTKLRSNYSALPGEDKANREKTRERERGERQNA